MTQERSGPDPASENRQAARESSHGGSLRRVIDFFDSTTKVLFAIGGLIAAATALWAGLTHFVSSGLSTSGRAQSATASFVVQPESCGALSFGADGNAGPVTCPDGRPNLAAVRYFGQLYLKVLSLGANASPSDVEFAICKDLATGSTFPIEGSAVQLATAEQNWHFGINPAQDIPGIAPDCRNIITSHGS